MLCKCGSDQILRVSGKVGDMCSCLFPVEKKYTQGYVHHGLEIGGGDYLTFDLCLNCGQVQGYFPIPSDHFQDAKDGFGNG
jgi:hypothetical protein